MSFVKISDKTITILILEVWAFKLCLFLYYFNNHSEIYISQ